MCISVTNEIKFNVPKGEKKVILEFCRRFFNDDCMFDPKAGYTGFSKIFYFSNYSNDIPISQLT